MINYYQFLVPRLNGAEIHEKAGYYHSLVKKGVAGFIIFGGRLGPLRKFIAGLQAEADLPLIISADLEQGLGQQVKGGTLFPPAMAMASAVGNRLKGSGFRLVRRKLLGMACRAIASEARYAGINTVFAPVLDINSNPANPIIAVRSFGEDAETVSCIGCEMIKTYRKMKIAACGKHFPGHGDTDVDSHLALPVIRRDLSSLENRELIPFRNAVSCGVEMMMLGHLSVPALDKTGLPASLSSCAVMYLRKRIGFRGLLVTDAMNMGGLTGFSEEEASAMALSAGMDILLHPSDPDRTAKYLSEKKGSVSGERLEKFRKTLAVSGREERPAFDKHAILARELAQKAIRVKGRFRVRGMPFLLLLSDDKPIKGGVFANKLKSAFSGMTVRHLSRGSDAGNFRFPAGTWPVVAVFSETRAWKGGVSPWLRDAIQDLGSSARLYISFGSPYVFHGMTSMPIIFACWDSPAAQEAVAEIITCHI